MSTDHPTPAEESVSPSRGRRAWLVLAGAGAAGLTAALSAAETGAEVILVDERADVGDARLAVDGGGVVEAPARAGERDRREGFVGDHQLQRRQRLN